MSHDRELRKGSAEVLLLSLLDERDRHGYELAKRLGDVADQRLLTAYGTLYRALGRMEQMGLLRSEWGVTEKNREARFYSLTAKGRRQLALEQESWNRLMEGVGRVLRYA